MATRLYLSAADVPSITPAFDAGFITTTGALRRKLLSAKRGTDTRATGSTINLTSLSTDPGLDRQYISEPLQAGQRLDLLTITGQLQVREFNALDDVTNTIMSVSVVSAGGTITPLSGLDASTSGTEFINNATCRNSTLPTLTLDAGGDYTTAAGDRLIVEIGYAPAVTGTTPQAAAIYGSGDGAAALASDLPVNETDTTATKAAWIEFDGTLAFALSTTLADGVSLADANTKAVATYLDDAIALADNEGHRAAGLHLADAIGLTDAQAKAVAHLLADAVSLTESKATVLHLIRSLADAIGLADANSALEDNYSSVPDFSYFVLGTMFGLQLGTGASQKLGFHGATPTVQAAFIANPTGGSTVDTEARAALVSINTILKAKGFEASS